MTDRNGPSRRFILGAGGVSLALPALFPRRARAAGVAPKRFVVYHVPEGIPVDDASIFLETPDYWWPKADLSSFPQASAAMAKYKDRLLFCKGVGFPKNHDVHVDGMRDLLAGGWAGAPERNVGGITLAPGMTIDQLLGQHLGKGATYKSYQIGILNHLEGVKEKRRISYSSSAGGRDPVNNPIKAYDDLLAGVAGAAPTGGDATPTLARRRLLARKSALDGVSRELAALRCALGADSRRKLEAYQESVREIETRLTNQLATQAPRIATAKPPRPIDAQGAEPFWGNTANAPALGEIQMRTAAAALAADVTRVIVFQWNQSVSRQTYPWLPVADKTMSGHAYAHAAAEKSERLKFAADRAVIFDWYSKQFVRFLDLLAETPDGEGSLLDSTAVLYCSEMGNGHHHATNLPFVLAGSRAFKQGRVLDLREGGAPLVANSRMVNDVLCGVIQAYGLPLSDIGVRDRNGRACTEILA